MHWISIVIIGIAANIDNLGIGVTFGARSTRVPFFSNLFIALFSMAATYLAMTAGSYFSHLFSAFWGNLIGGLVIVFLGIWGIRSSSIKNKQPAVTPDRIADRTDKDGDHVISWIESISLGFALSINCIASSFGAGASGVSPILSAISVGLFSLLSVDFGIRLGGKITKSWLGKYSDLMGCILLIAIGCYEIIF
ncbi:sporulation membrane protein YtaF [Cohnella endophytica]|uniref:Sporulation membrane protein YtaF n=1 Tax=Cohnella endophytica TaxID=2419778 RepID=A0A494XE14_9BACL|nr:manganese efflux pump [Cohnella endophytica]RKP47911.1 sporulation membrane protein YtaF [Cohnella endophytica]